MLSTKLDTQSRHAAHEKRGRIGSKLYVFWGVEGVVSSLESGPSPALVRGQPGEPDGVRTIRSPQRWPSGSEERRNLAGSAKPQLLQRTPVP